MDERNEWVGEHNSVTEMKEGNTCFHELENQGSESLMTVRG